MVKEKSVIFDAKFLAAGKQFGIKRDSEAFLNEFIQNNWHLSILSFKGLNLDFEKSDKDIPEIHVRKSVRTHILLSVILGSSIKLESPPASIYFLSQISPSKVTSKNQQINRVIRVHDLFPLTNPEWFTDRSKLTFKAGWKSLNESDTLIANSLYTKNNLLEYLGNRIRPENVRVIPCPPTNLTNSKPCSKCDFCKNKLDYGVFLLSVGTIEPRKNYLRLISAWKNAGLSYLNINLVVVGNVGWKSKESSRALINTLGVIHLQGICDYGLGDLYSKARAYISVSLDEGFNIPVQEAITSSLPLILSDIPVHRELMSGANAAWVNPQSTESITYAIKSLGTLKPYEVAHDQSVDFSRSFADVFNDRFC